MLLGALAKRCPRSLPCCPALNNSPLVYLGQNKLQSAFSCFAPIQFPSVFDLPRPHAFCEVAYSSGSDTEVCALHSPAFFDHTFKPPAGPGLLTFEVDGVRRLAALLDGGSDSERSW